MLDGKQINAAECGCGGVIVDRIREREGERMSKNLANKNAPKLTKTCKENSEISTV